MGNEQSSDVEENSQCGYRVLGIQENSPACAVGFVSFFDFIVEANGIRLDLNDSSFMELIAKSEDKPMLLSVYNVKSRTVREITMTPTQNWSGKGLLGVTIKFDTFEGAEDEVIHVLEVKKNSPADVVGLEAYNDFLLGTTERVFRDPDDLFEEIQDSLGMVLQCYVYNLNGNSALVFCVQTTVNIYSRLFVRNFDAHEHVCNFMHFMMLYRNLKQLTPHNISVKSDQVRIISLLPNNQWGGEGYLGGEVGHGYLHRLPESCRRTNGSSIGYVSIADGAVAATDQFTKTQNKVEGIPEDKVADEGKEQIIMETINSTGEEEMIESGNRGEEREADNNHVEVVGIKPERMEENHISTSKVPAVSLGEFHPNSCPISTVETIAD